MPPNAKCNSSASMKKATALRLRDGCFVLAYLRKEQPLLIRAG